MPRVTLAQAVHATLAYGAVFDYPLTKQELTQWLLFYPRRRLALDVETRVTLSKKGASLRLARTRWSEKKWPIANKAATLLRRIPSIKLVGVTGGLAMNNAHHHDDLDLFLITAPQTLWISRLWATLLMDIVGMRRRPKDTHVANKVCLNMFVSADGLAISRYERDVFTAHEVLQMVPLWERDGVYFRFLKANRWVKTFLPNAWEKRNAECQMMNDTWKTRKNISYILSIWYLACGFLEPLCKRLQLWYMKKRRTREVITDTMIRFHPHDARVWIRQKLARKLRPYHIPLDKIFYAS